MERSSWEIELRGGCRNDPEYSYSQVGHDLGDVKEPQVVERKSGTGHSGSRPA